MKKTIYPLPFLVIFKNFIKCGVIGWCMEILFTSLNALKRREFPIMGYTSPLMFPIYGCAALFKPLFRLFRNFNVFTRGTIYAVSIFGAEYTSGHFLSKHNICPWNYSNSRFHVNGLIRLDYFPYWFGAGLLFERILVSSIAQEDTVHKVPHDRKYSASCL